MVNVFNRMLKLIFSNVDNFDCNITADSIVKIDAYHPSIYFEFDVHLDEACLDYEDWIFNFDKADFYQININMGVIWLRMKSLELSSNDLLQFFLWSLICKFWAFCS